MYHHIAPVSVVPSTWVPSEGWNFRHSPEGFERQLLELRQRGYEFVSLAGLVDNIRSQGAEKPGTVAVTFDDGWLDNYEFALPVLKKLSIPATFFVTTGHTKNAAHECKQMGVAQLKELVRSGMEIGGHSRTHPDLRKVPVDGAIDEIRGCREDLEQALSVSVRFFAYPGGAFNRQTASLTQEAGYDAACSVLGPCRNDRGSIFWLYRDVLTESMNTWGDRYRLSPLARDILDFRVRRKVARQLEQNP